MAFELKSVFVRGNEIIAKKYTCNGANVSIPLSWTDPPEGTTSVATPKPAIDGHVKTGHFQ